MSKIGPGARLSTFLRLFLVQATFNYRTLIGSGVAFCLTPLLKRKHGDSVDELGQTLGRHVGLFNSHPYLAGMAVGAIGRMEIEGADAETVERFKVAVRGPLGALGDQLVWANWLPAIALLSAGAGIATGRPGIAVVAFLIVYNVGHLALRAWGLATGLAAGPLVAGEIRRANLPLLAARLGGLLAVAIGIVLGGLALAAGAGQRGAALWWGAATVLGFGVGAQAGPRAWRVMVAALVTVVLGLAVAGAIR